MLPADDADDGVAGNRITKNATPTITGVAPAGALVKLSKDGAVIASVNAAADGSFSVKPPSALADGPHALSLVANTNGTDSQASTIQIAIDPRPSTPHDRLSMKLAPVSAGLLSRQTSYAEVLPPGYNAQSTRQWPVLIHFHSQGENDIIRSPANPIDQCDDRSKLTKFGPLKHVEASDPLRNTPACGNRIAQDVIPDGTPVSTMCYSSDTDTDCLLVIAPRAQAVAPNGSTFSWIGTDSNAANAPENKVDTVEILEYVLNTYRVDRSRIYVTGLSQGGGAAFKLATTKQASNNTPYGALIAAMAAAPAHMHVATALEPGAAKPFPREFYSYERPGLLRDNLCAGIAATGLPVYAFHNFDDQVSTSAVNADHLAWAKALREILTGSTTSLAGVDANQTAAGCPVWTSNRYNLVINPGAGKPQLAGDPPPPVPGPPAQERSDGHTPTWQWAFNPLRSEYEGSKNLYQWLLSKRR